MSYPLPFKFSDRVLELGGGNNAIFPENIDIRPGAKTTIVADLNEPFPIENETYDGVFGNFIMEHIYLSRLRQFLSELHRILKPGGVACIITSNLLQQCQVLLEKEQSGEINDDVIHMLFGGNPDETWNYHHSSLTPQYAIKLFREAGFHGVAIYEHPVARQIWGRSTDMILEARKSRARIERSLWHKQ